MQKTIDNGYFGSAQSIEHAGLVEPNYEFTNAEVETAVYLHESHLGTADEGRARADIYTALHRPEQLPSPLKAIADVGSKLGNFRVQELRLENTDIEAAHFAEWEKELSQSSADTNYELTNSR